MGIVKGKQSTGSSLFSRDPDTLPFFSIHNKTIVGKILRIAFLVFFLAVIALDVLARATGLVFIHYFDYQFLIYLVPAVIILALIITALVKRIPIPALKILLVVIVAVFWLSVVSAMFSMLSHTGSLFAAYPEIAVSDGDTQFALMRVCLAEQPDAEQYRNLSEENTLILTRRHESRYLVSAPGAESSGEILLPFDSPLTPECEWIDERTARVYVPSEDSEEYGTITVTFGDGAAEASDIADPYRIAAVFTNEDASRSFELLAQEYEYADPFSKTASDFRREYIIFPAKARMFFDVSVYSEGSIVLEPFRVIEPDDIEVEVREKGVFLFRLSSESAYKGHGEVLVDLNRKAENAAAEDEAAPEEEPAPTPGIDPAE